MPVKSAVVPNTHSTTPERGLANRTLSRADRQRDTPRTNNSRTIGHGHRRSTHAISNSADCQPSLDITVRDTSKCHDSSSPSRRRLSSVYAGISTSLLQNIAEQQAKSTGNGNRRIQNGLCLVHKPFDINPLNTQI